jgi:lysophospholipase L1-like esterase
MMAHQIARAARRPAPMIALCSALIGLLTALAPVSAPAQLALPCGPFTHEPVLPEPAPRDHINARERFERIKAALKTQPYKVLFLGDSLTEGFDREVWQAHMAPRGVLNAGVSGDRTDHLLWRLTHGNLDGPPPRVVVLLIGTNDLGYGRSPELTAEGIRANLLHLSQHLPDARILLLGLWPRADLPKLQEHHDIDAVNQLIAGCSGGAVTYAALGSLLLEPDVGLSPQISPDRLHFNGLGYARLAPRLDALIDQLLGER